MNRTAIIIGEGARGADLSDLGGGVTPILSSWQAADVIDNLHPLYFGRPGVFGQRCANKVLYHADEIVALGCRLSIMTIGHTGLRPEQHLQMVDIDAAETSRFPGAFAHRMTVAEYLTKRKLWTPNQEWLEQCKAWREAFPYFDRSHRSKSDGCINAYEAIYRLEGLLPPDAVIVTDMGVALAGAFQVLRIRAGQRLMTSGGLGEMGCGLPAAIGASFARGKGEVICLHCDGGMMMNLQELATIAHHRLPIKIIAFANDGYAMLKSTERNYGMPYSGVNAQTGVSLPELWRIAEAFGIETMVTRTVSELPFHYAWLLKQRGPALLQVNTDPEQEFSPKLQPIMRDGRPSSPTFEELSP